MSSVVVFFSLPMLVASALKELRVRPGQDATLQCWGPRNAHITLLEWSRPELISQGYVFFFQDQRSYENYQHESFKGRVQLRDPSMKDGDVTVILRNVSVSDTGAYECQITTSSTRNGERVVKEFKHSINLTVTESVQINITAGQNVILPCRAPNIDSNSKAVVKWSRADLGKDYVLLYRDEQPDPEEQHPSFKNRVDLQNRQIKDGDASLILKDVTTADSGTYECRVFRRTNRRKRANLETDPISVISLKVDPPGQTGGDTEDGVSRGHAGLMAVLSLFAVIAALAIFIKLNPPPPLSCPSVCRNVL
ncbi:V-set and immunoglobulin domain-containing protein 8 [Oreochromis niloticus]|uniref:V-set and immunoglobulin domain-containing protein 8 n=1 Tax=Oreochromis niloticus TaxID=8128 RepID=UPI000393EA4D|nr:V-set and immunoglobulin domain-containing protein 8 [Oreochromis niloticus]